MAEKGFAMHKLEEVLSASPEIAPPVRQAFELLAGATVGHRISKYGVKFGVAPAFKALADATKVPALRDYADPISRGIVGGASALLLFVLKGKWSRIITWGALFENVEAGINYVETAVGVK
ncbi:MAG: hypothetical protein ACPL1Z_05850 [Candidatus Bathyarchaeales archaeon]